jgi:hypothetical protein
MNGTTPAAAGLLRALAFFHATSYAPTVVEWIAAWDAGSSFSSSDRDEVATAVRALQQDGAVTVTRGRVTLPDTTGLVAEHERREVFFARKLRRARLVARYLSRLAGVRFVALCNTTALAHAADESDLDFFIITRSGAVWQTRLFATVPFKFLGLRPAGGQSERDAVCLSFFIDESALDLSALAITADDPYLRHWFLSLFPLYDDGIGERLWDANAVLRSRHPFAPRWQTQPKLLTKQPFVRWPVLSSLERFTRPLQTKAFPHAVKQRMNQATDVVVNDHVLKFHVDDARDSFRSRYVERCRTLGIEP